jgi:hypothetical protein
VGTTADPTLAFSWGGTDGAGVASYDVEVSVDGGPFVPWLTATPRTSAAYVGTAGSRYRFRVRAIDALGNVSAFVDSEETVVAGPPTAPVPPQDDSRPRTATPRLTLTSSRRSGRRLRIRGTVGAAADGRVTLTWSATVARRRHRVRTSARVRGGSFAATVRIPPEARSARRARLVVRFRADAASTAQTRRFILRSR